MKFTIWNCIRGSGPLSCQPQGVGGELRLWTSTGKFTTKTLYWPKKKWLKMPFFGTFRKPWHKFPDAWTSKWRFLEEEKNWRLKYLPFTSKQWCFAVLLTGRNNTPPPCECSLVNLLLSPVISPSLICTTSGLRTILMSMMEGRQAKKSFRARGGGRIF